MIIPRVAWISLAVASGLLLVGGTVWYLRVRSVRNLIVLDVPAEPVVLQPEPVASSSTATSIKAPTDPSDEIVHRPVFFAPEPRVLPGINIVYPSEGGVRGAPQTQGAITHLGSEDADSDGLTNDQELQLGTDPNKADTDGDGLSDGDEVKRYRTDPLKVNTDGDKYSDAEEIKNGYNPLGTGKCLTTDCAF